MNFASKRQLLLVIGILSIITEISGDVYFHNPRGSNNRLDEAGRNRNNANRVFDSQNNDRGGYNVGSLYYYAGSKLQIEWTNQHSCNSPNNHCELVLQFMCDNNIRDGVTTRTIPENPAQCYKYDCNTDKRYGMHESFSYYLQCKARQRNAGLFIADQNLRQRKTAKFTRQNPGGTRRGYECPEERDYYPYWHPTPWKDIAVMTNDVKRCEYYKSESENVKGRWGCYIPIMLLLKKRNLIVPNNKEDCEKFRYPPGDVENGVRGKWMQYPAHQIPAPECRETQFSRDNHLGNGIGGHPNVYNWTIPNIQAENCVLRIRYNISTNDYDAWKTDSSSNSIKPKQPTKVDLSKKYGFVNIDSAEDRGYVFEGNPEVKVFEDDIASKFELQLAINTAQYGRVFQDRSHSFAIRKRPENLEEVQIQNLNVRGKRGNIVQVYPAVEYDFVPNTLEASPDHYVHIQWTGSNTNPNNNDGQGKAGTDRNNLVLLGKQVYPEGSGRNYGPGSEFGHYGVNYPMHLSNTSFLGFSQYDLQQLALLSPRQYGGEMSELDDAGTYFDIGPRKVTQKGTYHYMCTRNNNFSNRDQKGRILVYPFPSEYFPVGMMGGNISSPDHKASIKIEKDTFKSLEILKVESLTKEQGDAAVKQAGQEMNVGDGYASDYLVISPQKKLTDNKKITVSLTVDSEISGVDVYRSTGPNFHTWTKMEANIDNGVAMFQVDSGGTFVARSQTNVGLIVGVSIMCIVIIVVFVGSILYFRRYPSKWQAVRTFFRRGKRSMSATI